MAECWRNDSVKKEVLKALSEYNEIIFFDTETTGFSSTNDRIIEFAATKVEIGNENFVTKETFHGYIRPEFPIPEKITEITGITNEMLEDKPCEADVFERIYEFFGDAPPIVCAHNTPFDMRFLKSLYNRYGKEISPIYMLDTLEMARDLVKDSKHKLCALAEYYGLTDNITFHSALDDTKVAVLLFERFYKEYLSQQDASKDVFLIHPVIKSVSYWCKEDGFFPRIYVNTDCGTVYYDVHKKTWFSKDAELDTLDMSAMEHEALRVTNCENIEAFAMFSGKVVVA